MAFWENMPYTNFHGENQDWIIKTMKKLIAVNRLKTMG